MNIPTTLSRRAMLRHSTRAAASVAILAPDWSPLFATPEKRRFKLGACDWSIGKMGTPDAFEVARQIGLDGVQVSLGTAANDMQLRRPELKKQYLNAAHKAGL